MHVMERTLAFKSSDDNHLLAALQPFDVGGGETLDVV